MGLSNKSSVMAIMQETTEGVPVVPAAPADFIALQDGFSLEPSFANLENKEIKASIGPSKSIIGLEEPKASISHYLRHSGVEGQAPNFKQLLRAVFGSEVLAGTQYPTVAASTVSVVKVGSGIGANFQRGQALLIKDPVNGYSIRVVQSVSGDDITLGFNLLNAPGTGVGLGKACLYKPLNSGHPTLSIWNYRANGGAIELIAGVRVTESNFDFGAGDLINGSYSLDGIQYFFDPIVITSSTSKLDFLDNATTRVITLAVKVYKDPVDLASAIETALNSLGSANTFTCSYSHSTGKFTVTSTGSTLSLLWNTGANTANSIATKIGFSTAADSTGALTYTSDNPLNLGAPYSPSYDNADPLAAKDNELFIGDNTSTAMIHASKVGFKIGNSKASIKDVTAVSGISGSIIKDRKVTVSVSAIMNQYDADKFKRLRAGDNTRFLYNFGTKSGGNWIPGKCGCLYLPTAVVTSFKPVDNDGLVFVDFDLEAYVDSTGAGEVYLNFV